MTLNLTEECRCDFEFDCHEVAFQVMNAILDKEKCPYEATVDLTLTDDRAIHEINLQQRGIDRATDVLSFPMVDYEAPADYGILESDDALAMYFNPESGELLLGDIVISVERAFEQAENYGHSIKREICFLTAHSMLHLLGYDHMEDEERIVMEKKQEEILNALGIKRDC